MFKWRLSLLAPVLFLIALLPIMAGLLGIIRPAFGVLPAIGRTQATLDPFRDVMAEPGIWRAISLSFTTGLLATSLSLLIVVLFLARFAGTPSFSRFQAFLSPLLSVPHAAAAFGIAFIIAPSGWIMRLLSPWATGSSQPPDVLILNDPLGLSLVAGLVVKEIPFLLLMSVAALGQIDTLRSRHIAASLGYGMATGWFKTVLPLVYRQIRLPVLAVLSFSMTVVDVALILGPSTPPTLSVLTTRMMASPDISERLIGSASALVQLGVVLVALAFWITAEKIVARIGRTWLASGERFGVERLASIGAAAGLFAGMLVFAGLASLLVWSLAGFWGYPDALPSQITPKNWIRFGPEIIATASQTMAIALVASVLAVLIAIVLLQAQLRATWLIYIPLIVPQVVFLPGLANLMLAAQVGPNIIAVTAAHLVFVLPYVLLSLADPFRAWDHRFGIVGSALGASGFGVLVRIKLPMLLRPILIALAIGIAVSVAQYLPTLLIGSGRVRTLTTEALALASGGDRRAIGVYALSQTLAALVPFGLALLIPFVVWRNRKDLRNV